MSSVIEEKKINADTSQPFSEALVVGAGFAGLYMLHRLRGLGISARVLEAGDGVGGTWYWNRYPGARCDVESMEYSYQFSEELQQEWEWTERYATQPEILRYLEHVSERFDLLRDIQFNTRVQSADFDQNESKWCVETSSGQTFSCQFLVMATGCLSSVNTPHFEGMSDFSGSCYHTGHWPHEPIDFTGRRVAIIGTGSSAIQSIPVIAEQAKMLHVFQRTPNFSIPAGNRPLEESYVQEVKSRYPEFRAEGRSQGFGIVDPFPPSAHADPERIPTRQEVEESLQERWDYGGITFLNGVPGLTTDPALNELAADFVRRKIREEVSDPEVADALSPSTMVGCKRLCVDTNYFSTYNRSNVKLVDISQSPIDKIVPEGVSVSGKVYACDDLILATGFDAMTGALSKVEIKGREGLTLADKWKEGPRTYLGLATEGFPNLFIVTGPGSPSVLSNMVQSIEQHVEWISDCMVYMKRAGLVRIEPKFDAEEEWVTHVNELADQTIFPTCNSWYLGANVPGKPRVFMPYLGFPPYVEICRDVADSEYKGFQLA
ncbi:MAG: cyclohexanone monooxygenase [Deltaproteobacteria bacterium]|nr:cyclohexanone monooxygenase [Deltaproteobacteria bacterium]